MSAPIAPPPPAPAVPAAGSGGQPKRNVGTIVAVAVVVVALLAGLLVLLGLAVGGKSLDKPADNKQLGDPGNYHSNGGGALAETLKSHGVTVRIARDQRGVRKLPTASSSTVVVVSYAENASTSTSKILRERSRNAKRVVLLAPGPKALAAWDVPTDTPTNFSSATTAGCTVPGMIAPTDAASSSEIGLLPFETDAISCFTTIGVSSLVVFPARGDRPEVVVAPQSWFINEGILDRDNAGIGVRMVGAGSEVNWFAPDVFDRNNDNDHKYEKKSSVKPDVPRWVWPSISLGAFVLFALMLWRGRRFGQLISEPLPAVVKATETTESRGRLYQASGDAPRAAAQLREHAMRTIPRRLGVSRYAPVEEIVETVSRATGRDPAVVHALLVGPLPVDDAGLVRFATDLSTLEEEVRPVL